MSFEVISNLCNYADEANNPDKTDKYSKLIENSNSVLV